MTTVMMHDDHDGRDMTRRRMIMIIMMMMITTIMITLAADAT